LKGGKGRGKRSEKTSGNHARPCENRREQATRRSSVWKLFTAHVMGKSDLRLDDFMAVTMKNAVSWDMMTSCGSCKSRCFGGTHRLHHQGKRVPLVRSKDMPLASPSVVRYTLTANQEDSFTLKIEAIGSSETSVLTRTTQRNHIP
jgi:hypothetical protein